MPRSVAWKMLMNPFGSELATTSPLPTMIVSMPRMM